MPETDAKKTVDRFSLARWAEQKGPKHVTALAALTNESDRDRLRDAARCIEAGDVAKADARVASLKERLAQAEKDATAARTAETNAKAVVAKFEAFAERASDSVLA